MHYNDIVRLSLWDRMRIQLFEAAEALVLAVVPRGSRRRRLLARIERELTLRHEEQNQESRKVLRSNHDAVLT